MSSLASLIPALTHVTQHAAIACAPFVGRGDKHGADDAATSSMRTTLGDLPLDGTVVIGEGERDNAPMLYIGEQLGTGGTAIDIAVDPLEGTNLCAYHRPGAITVIGIGPAGSLLHAPDTYMDKRVVGPAVTEQISLDMPLTERLSLMAAAYDCPIPQLTIIMLDRPRNTPLRDDIIAAGARVTLISDGDVCASIQALMGDTTDHPVHTLMGIGAAPEGVLSAIATSCLGGQMSARLMPYDSEMTSELPDVIDRMISLGLDKQTIYTASDLAAGDDLVFTATGVTTGPVLAGLEDDGDGLITTHSLVLSTSPTPIQQLTTTHIVA